MGEYAAYIWSAYGAAALILIGLVATTVLRLRGAQKRLAVLEEQTARLREVPTAPVDGTAL